MLISLYMLLIWNSYFTAIAYIKSFSSAILDLRTPNRLNGLFQTSSDNIDINPIDSSQPFQFGGIKFKHPISSSLKELGITQPSPIQNAALVPIATGVTCLVHGETGSGKTLAYLLPLLKRVIGYSSQPWPGVKALILVPSRELAIQVTTDMLKLTGFEFLSSVKLLIDLPNVSLDTMSPATIVIGTATPLQHLVSMSSDKALNNIDYLVIDEVDRVLRVLGKYASVGQQLTRDKSSIVAKKLLEKIVERRKNKGTLRSMQIVAVSATVGRLLKREISNIFHLNVKDGFPILRATESHYTNTRAVSIPLNIDHLAFVMDPEQRTYDYSVLSDRTVSRKAIMVKHLWQNNYRECRRGILFVPSNDDVKQILGMMRFWGVREVKNLRESMGITSNSFSEDPDQSKYIESHVNNSIGMEGQVNKQRGRELFIISISSARGLHVKDVGCVMILKLPKTMDEYLHIAGRTGRYGNTCEEGNVVSFVNGEEELRRILSWRTPLGIDVNVVHEKDVNISKPL